MGVASNLLPQDPDDPRREIERLYRLEFGEVDELAFRMIGSAGGALIIWLYTGWTSAWVWIALYAALQLGYIGFLSLRRERATARDVQIASAVFPLLLASYIWMPIRMIAAPEDALSVSGFCMLACVIIYIVRRSEQDIRMTVIEIGVLAIGLAAGGVAILLRPESLVGKIGLIFAMATLLGYLLQGAFIVRRQRIAADEMADRVRQAEKLEAIGRLAGGVAHDFNNMLTAVLGNLDLIEETEDPALKRELVDEARLAARRGAQVVRQLLTYARQTDGRPRRATAESLLGQVEALCRTLVPASVALQFSLPEAPEALQVDEALFAAALLNLIKNSVDAMEGAGAIRIAAVARVVSAPLHCAAGQSLPPGQYFAFSVSDTGPGIPGAILNRVTDPFFTTKKVGSGSGLGLAMVTGFAARSGGGLQIRSSDRGTEVTLILPKASADQA